MEEFNYSSLAPRQGTRPLLSAWSDIGTSQMNGGALNWGSLWSGLKSLGGTVKNRGSKVWHSDAGHALRQKLKDTALQEKIIEGVSSGIHGAVDLSRQRLEKAIERHLEKRPTVDALESAAREEDIATSADASLQPPPPPPPPYSAVVSSKRPREDGEEVIIHTAEPPPPYEDVMATPAPVVASTSKGLVVDAPVTRPAKPFAPVTHETQRVVAPLPMAATTVRRQRGWQGTLNSIVGLGVHSVKRRRCYV